MEDLTDLEVIFYPVLLHVCLLFDEAYYLERARNIK